MKNLKGTRGKFNKHTTIENYDSRNVPVVDVIKLFFGGNLENLDFPVS